MLRVIQFAGMRRLAILAIGILALVSTALLVSVCLGADAPVPRTGVGGVGDYLSTGWTSSQGLPEDWVECILRTRDGYLWLGTPKGLIRFDGTSFLHFDRENCPAFVSEVCKALAEDSSGNLWVATKKGLLRFGAGGVERVSLFGAGEAGAVEVSSICASRGGGVWVGTSRGVALVRGGSIRRFPAVGFRSAFVYSILEDAGGHVWVGMIAGLYRLDENSGAYHPVWEPSGRLGDEERSIPRCLCDDGEGGVWFGTDHAVMEWRGDRVAGVELGGIGPEFRVKSLLRDRKSMRWAVIGNVLHRWDGAAYLPVDSLYGLTDLTVNCVYEDEQGTVWVGSRRGGLTRLRPVPFRLRTQKDGLPGNSIRSVAPRKAGGVWVATSRGVGSFDGQRFQPLGSGSSWTNTELTAVSEDRSGGLWVGTSGGGLFLCSSKNGAWETIRVPSSLASCRAILCQPDGGVWGGFADGLMHIPATAERFKVSDRDWWVPGARPGAWSVAKAESIVSNNNFCWMKRGAKWMRSGDAVRSQLMPEELDSIGMGWLQDLLPLNDPGWFDMRALESTPDDTVWFGSDGGGLIRLRAGRFDRFTVKEGLASDFVSSLWADQEGYLWVGTSRGLCWFHHDGRVGSFAVVGGVLREPISCLLSDDVGHLWLGTEGALSRFELRELRGLAGSARPGGLRPFVTIGETEGLPSLSPSGGGQPRACLSRDGLLWFATAQGLVTLDPDLVETRKRSPAVQIEEVTAGSSRAAKVQPWLRAEAGAVPLRGVLVDSATSQGGVSPTSDSTSGRRSPMGIPGNAGEAASLWLPPGSGRRVEIRYSLPEVLAPERVEFACRLDGNDAEWVAVGGRRVAYYTNLKPGRYRFHVKAKDKYGDWADPLSPPSAILMFEVAPQISEMLWLRLGAVLLFCVGFAVFARWRIREFKRREALERRVALSELRTRIADDLHDDIGASLSRAARECAMAAAGGRGDGSISRRISIELESALADLEQIVLLLQPRNDTLRSFGDQLQQLADRYFEMSAVRRRWSIPVDLPLLPIHPEARRDLVLFCKEVLANALKHAKPSEVGLTLEFEEGWLVLSIADDGSGFDPAGATRGNGLASLARRAARLGAVFDLDSALGKGTRIRLRVPVERLASGPPAT